MNWKDERDKLLLEVPRTPSKFWDSIKNLCALLFIVRLKVSVEGDEKPGRNVSFLEGINFDRPDTLRYFVIIRRYFWAIFAIHLLLLAVCLCGGFDPVPLLLTRIREFFQELTNVLYIFLNFYLWMYDRKYTEYILTDKPGVAISVDGRLQHIFDMEFEKFIKQLLRPVPEEDLAGLAYVYVSYSSEHEEGPMKDSLGYYFPGTSPYIILFAKTIWDHCPEHVDIMPFFFDILFTRILYDQVGFHVHQITPPDPIRAPEAERYGTMMYRRYFYGRWVGRLVRYFRIVFKLGIV